MRVKGVDSADIEVIVADVSRMRYDNNIVIKTIGNAHNSRGLRSHFTIRALDSHGPGARTSASGRHMPVACWHAHWHVLDRLFFHWPLAEVVTKWYEATAETFHDRAGATAYKNVGSAFSPVRPTELCDCDDAEWLYPMPTRRQAESLTGLPFQDHPDRDRPKVVEPLENRMAREIAEAEATMAWPVNAYSWSASTPHLYEEGLRDGKTS